MDDPALITDPELTDTELDRATRTSLCCSSPNWCQSCQCGTAAGLADAELADDEGADAGSV